MIPILTLDGGGTWALVQAQALGALYGPNTPGHAILAQFDLVAANSGGSLVLGGLLANRTPRQIQKLFTDLRDREQIFKRRFWSKWPGIGAVAARYETEAKLAGLDRVFARYRPALDGLPCNLWTLANLEAQLRQASPALFPPGRAVPRIVIAGFELDRCRATFFRSPPGELGDPRDQLRLIEAMHFSSNAPIRYFDAPATAGLSHATAETPFWDGAMGGHNNPAMIALLEVLKLGWPTYDLALLALGTGSVQLPLATLAPHGTTESYSKPRLAEAGFFATLGTAAGAILDDPPDAATFAADLLLQKLTPPRAPGPRCVRLSPLVRPRWAAELARLGAPRFGVSGPPDASDEALFLKLRDLDMDATDSIDVAAIVTLGEAWLRDEVTNQTLTKRTDGLPGSVVDWRAATAALRAWQNLVLPPSTGWAMLPVTAPATRPY
jgi:hypothetical protein